VADAKAAGLAMAATVAAIACMGGRSNDRSSLEFFSITNVRECSMLVLTRKYQEKIRIGNNITITVLRMKGKAVRLGIEAPAEVPVIRGELSFTNEAAAMESNEATTLECHVECDESPRGGRTIGRMVGISTPWPTDVSSTREPAATIEFTRVPREKVAHLLPKTMAGQAPLRAMMIQATRG
jgi:carbon storage regulator